MAPLPTCSTVSSTSGLGRMAGCWAAMICCMAEGHTDPSTTTLLILSLHHPLSLPTLASLLTLSLSTRGPLVESLKESYR